MQKVFIALTVLLVGAVGYFYGLPLLKGRATTDIATTQEGKSSQSKNLKTYTGSSFSFSYPDKYLIQELGDNEVSLVPKDESWRLPSGEKETFYTLYLSKLEKSFDEFRWNYQGPDTDLNDPNFNEMDYMVETEPKRINERKVYRQCSLGGCTYYMDFGNQYLQLVVSEAVESPEEEVILKSFRINL